MRVGLSTAGPGTLLHQLNVNVVRRVNAPVPLLAPLDTSQGLRVLTIVCRPDDAGFLDPRYTPEAILEALAERPEVEVDFCRPGTLAASGPRSFCWVDVHPLVVCDSSAAVTHRQALEGGQSLGRLPLHW